MTDKPNPECRGLIKEWRSRDKRIPAFIRDLTLMAVKHGADMRCLQGD
jgi:hypothetical protein